MFIYKSNMIFIYLISVFLLILDTALAKTFPVMTLYFYCIIFIYYVLRPYIRIK